MAGLWLSRSGCVGLSILQCRGCNYVSLKQSCPSKTHYVGQYPMPSHYIDAVHIAFHMGAHTL